MKPQLSVVIPTLNAGLGLKTSLNAVLQQQTAPSFEVLVVSQWPLSELETELKAWDPRFRYLCSGQKGINCARNLGLKEASSEIILFLDDESWIDDRLFLKKHLDAHQKSPQAIGVGGIYRRKVDANPFELAYFVTNSWLRARGRIDGTRSTTLAPGNMSFKTIALRSTFEFNEEIGLGASTVSLMDRLTAAGQELQFTERLSIEHRPHFGAIGLIYRAVNQGRGNASYKNANPGWKFAGAALTRRRHMQESSIPMTRKLEFALWLYDFAFSAGSKYTKNGASHASLSIPACLRLIGMELLRRAKALPFEQGLSGLFIALRSQLKIH